MSTFNARGRVIDKTSGSGLSGLRVEAWDKDLFVDDQIGSILTDSEGRFSLQFNESYFSELFFDREPDLFFKVYDGGELLRSTEDSVLWNVAGDTKDIVIEVEGNTSMGKEEASLPAEIPWQLAANTQISGKSGPYETTVALFHYQPELPALKQAYPDHCLVYFKVAASVSPYRAAEDAANDLISSYLDTGLPIWHLLLDLRVTSNGGSETVIPYFHSAAPLRRSMLQTGIIGADAFEGESNGLAVGKSGSQFHETVSAHSTVKTKKSGGGGFINLGFIGGGGSVTKTTTSTTAGSEREIKQDIDSMSRSASTERRELLSHTTNVDNVLTLLTAKHIGSPYLRFSLWPRPMTAMSMDPSDPNLWYHQLLRRRSSGIDGLQEFFAVAMVPRDADEFSVDVEIRRVSALDTPPSWPRYYSHTDILLYLRDTYPEGTPLDELDVDIIVDQDKFIRPVVLDWRVDLVRGYTWFVFGSPPKSAGNVQAAGSATYKHIRELWLEMYERDLRRSPLERGDLVVKPLKLQTEFSLDGESCAVAVTDYSVVYPGTFSLAFDARIPPVASHLARLDGYSSAPYEQVHAITAWNSLEEQLAGDLVLRTPDVPGPVGPVEPMLFEHVLDLWRHLAPTDPKNLLLSDVAKRLDISPEQQQLLNEQGVTDLRGLADALRESAEQPPVVSPLQGMEIELPEGVELETSVVSRLPFNEASDLRRRLRAALKLEGK